MKELGLIIGVLGFLIVFFMSPIIGFGMFLIAIGELIISKFKDR